MIEIQIDFARPALKEEFERAHPRVRATVLYIAQYCAQRGWPAPVITHVERTWDQHVKIYGPDKAKHFFSPHLARPSRAVDLRSSLYTREQISEIVEHVNEWFKPHFYDHPIVLFHNVGRGDHFHVQTPPDVTYLGHEVR